MKFFPLFKFTNVQVLCAATISLRSVIMTVSFVSTTVFNLWSCMSASLCFYTVLISSFSRSCETIILPFLMYNEVLGAILACVSGVISIGIT